MQLTCEDLGLVGVLTPAGPRLDAVVAAEFRNAAREHMSAGPAVWMIDLSNITFVDSTGVGALVGLLKFVGKDRRLELCGMSPTVQRVFRLTRLDTVFVVHADLTTGLGAHGVVRKRAAG